MVEKVKMESQEDDQKGNAKKDLEANKAKNMKQRHISVYYMESKGPTIGCRHIQTILMFFGFTIGIAQRTGMSVAIVAMVDNSTSSNPDIPTYNWDNTSVILSSFFWGYIWLQVLAGYLGKKYGVKWILLAAHVINHGLFVIIPWIAGTLGAPGVIVCRTVQGLAQGFFIPSCHNFLGKWAPSEERSVLASVLYSGQSMGVIVGSLAASYVSVSDWGWPGYFYIFGILGSVWSVVWAIFGHSGPNSHPRISVEEKKYIETSLSQIQDTNKIPTPWVKIFTSIHFWAIVFAYFGTSWGYSLGVTETPTYLKNAMKFSITATGLISGLTVIGTSVFVFVFGFMSDWVIKKKILSRVNARRFFQVLGSFGIGICYIAMGFLDVDQKLEVIVALVMSNIFIASYQSAATVNVIDLSPRFSGIMMGFINGTGQGLGMFAPLLVQIMVPDLENLVQWRTMFIVAAVVYMVSSVLYCCFASGTRQNWDGPANPEQERIKKASVYSLTSR